MSSCYVPFITPLLKLFIKLLNSFIQNFKQMQLSPRYVQLRMVQLTNQESIPQIRNHSVKSQLKHFLLERIVAVMFLQTAQPGQQLNHKSRKVN